MAGAPAQNAVQAKGNEARQKGEEDHIEKLEIVHLGFVPVSSSVIATERSYAPLCFLRASTLILARSPV